MIKLELTAVAFIIVYLTVFFIVFVIVNIVFISSIKQQTHSQTFPLLILPLVVIIVVIVIAFTFITFSIPIIVWAIAQLITKFNFVIYFHFTFKLTFILFTSIILSLSLIPSP